MRNKVSMWLADGMYAMLPYSSLLLESVPDLDTLPTSRRATSFSAAPPTAAARCCCYSDLCCFLKGLALPYLCYACASLLSVILFRGLEWVASAYRTSLWNNSITWHCAEPAQLSSVCVCHSLTHDHTFAVCIVPCRRLIEVCNLLLAIAMLRVLVVGRTQYTSL